MNVEVVNATAEVTVLGPASVVVQQANTEVEVAVGGAQGPTGPQGPSGVIAVTAPITNSGTSTSANIGVTVGTTSDSVASGDRGLPTGGTTGQALVKSSSSNYATTWATVGKVLQVVTTTKLNVFATVSTSFIDVPDFSVNITPSSTSSRIIVSVSIGTQGNNNSGGVNFYNIMRDSTNLQQPSPTVANPATFMFFSNNAFRFEPANMLLVDSPATTSQITYKVQMRVSAGGGWFNRAPSGASEATGANITVIEVGP